MQRLDLKTVRYERMTDAVLFDGRKIVLAVTRDALEALFNIELSPDEALLKAVDEVKRLTVLADVIPADDGRITVTKDMLLNDGVFDPSLKNA
ncbi:MAG: hypothetical protein COC17_04595 [Hyphomicrobiales bacterium]|nr:hypothetical protein [Hyphomicrobiales bacterium]PCH50597.1 MAG: hypothetical protein COC17_04595 [Hyphomicrobiales bacterium]